MIDAGSSDDPTQNDDEHEPRLPPDPKNRVRRSFWIDTELDRLLRAEALRRHTTEAAILRDLLRRHFRLP
ncbi:MAG: hypothetical protein ACOC92_02125 [bacterium]